jgi:hypothetical protein
MPGKLMRVIIFAQTPLSLFILLLVFCSAASPSLTYLSIVCLFSIVCLLNYAYGCCETSGIKEVAPSWYRSIDKRALG